MPDFSLRSRVTLAFGRSGSGKTTFVIRYLLNAVTVQAANPSPAACIFVYDFKGEVADRLRIQPCVTEAQCELMLQTRWVVFNPIEMFKPEEKKEPANLRGFRWFCRWVYSVSKRGPGRKILWASEVGEYVENRSDMLPAELETVLRQGRIENLEFISDTQFPKDYARLVRGSVTEWVCFSTTEPDDLEAVRPYYRGVDKIAELPLGAYIAYFRDTGAEMRGKLF